MNSRTVVIYIARGVRGFRDGVWVITLPAYLATIGYSAAQIGVIATVTLLGMSLFTLCMSFIAPRHEIRNLLMIGAALVAFTGLSYSNVEHIVLIAAIAFIGTISPMGGDLSVAMPLEHAMLAQS